MIYMKLVYFLTIIEIKVDNHSSVMEARYLLPEKKSMLFIEVVEE